MAKQTPAKCADCGSGGNVFPWSTRVGDRYSYVWRCGPCQYKHLHPEATPMPPTPRRPKVPQAEVLPFDADD